MDAFSPSAAPPGREPLLATKLSLPRLRPGLVPRPDLVERLNQGLARQVTLVSAPAGFGKTTLVSAWAHSLRLPVAWLALEAADNDPTRFLRYLVAALRQIDPAIRPAVSPALETAPPPPAAVVAALINDLTTQTRDFALVLDDFHTIDHPAVHEAVRSLVTHQPPALHLVIVTREDPPLPLARLRARGELVELRGHDLRFSLDEAAAFLRDGLGLSLDPSAMAELDRRIEGWAAGLQLAGLSLKGRANPAELIATLSSSHHFILSYLTEEVLRQLAPDTQAFLLDTSILSRLSGPLCDAVTGRSDSAAALEGLYTSNAFVIPLDDDHHWYRYHHLFADLLRNQLQRLHPERIPALHLAASAWHEQQGDAVEAVEHAFAAVDHARVDDLLERQARPVVLQGYAQTVETWLRRLPPLWRATGPRANLAFAWSLLLRGRPAEIEPYLRDAETAADQTGPTASVVRAEALALRAALVSLSGDTAAGVALARQAVEQAPADDLYLQGMARFCLGAAYNYAGRVADAVATYQVALPLCRASGNTVAAMLAVANLAVLYMAQGQLRAAAALCREVITDAEQTAALPSPPLATVYLAYSDVLYQWNDLDAAHNLAERWLELSRRGGHVAAVAYGSVVLSRIRLGRGDQAGAEAALSQAEALLGRGMPAWVAPAVVAQQVDLALARGDLNAAAEALARSGVTPDSPPSHTRGPVHLAYLRLALRQAHAGQRAALAPALRLAGQVLSAAEAGGRMGQVIETLVHRAWLYQAQGDTTRAQADLARARTLAAPEGYVRLFVSHAMPMRGVGTRERETEGLEIGAWGDPDTPPPVEPLTEREREVLRLIADGLTYAEIAQRLVVSVNTVRFHVKGVYGKLGVDRRAAAVERARALRWL